MRERERERERETETETERERQRERDRETERERGNILKGNEITERKPVVKFYLYEWHKPTILFLYAIKIKAIRDSRWNQIFVLNSRCNDTHFEKYSVFYWVIIVTGITLYSHVIIWRVD